MDPEPVAKTNERKPAGLSKSLFVVWLRILACLAFLYVAAGCVIFPLWWKEFLIFGGFTKGHFWRDAFELLGNHFKQWTPLASLMICCVLLILFRLIYGLGRHADKNEGKKIAFVETLAPGFGTVAACFVICLVAIFSAYLQPGLYSDFKAMERSNRLLEDMAEKIAQDQPLSLYEPPSTGIYLYINDKLVLQQNEALRGDLEIKSVTESVGSEKRAGVTASLPLEAGSVDISGKKTSEKTITKSAPDVSAISVVRSLIKRFDENTNTCKISAVTFLGRKSGWIVSALEKKGVHLTDEQTNQLYKADVESFAESLKGFQERQIILGRGLMVTRKTSALVSFELKCDSSENVKIHGEVSDTGMRDLMRFEIDANPNQALFNQTSMLGIIQKVETESSGRMVIKVLPYALW